MSKPTGRDLVELLKELDDAHQDEGMPVGARNRVRLALQAREEQRREGRRKWLPVASFAAGAALVLAVLGLRWGGEDDVEAALPSADLSVAAGPRLTGAFALAGDGCTAEPGGGPARARVGGGCRLVADHMSVQVWESAEVSADRHAFVVHEGEVLFDVETVRPGATPVRVQVSHGVIEVVGTRFAVEQDADGGHVDLLEGKIRFREPGGDVVEIAPGQRHSWGRPTRGRCNPAKAHAVRCSEGAGCRG